MQRSLLIAGVAAVLLLAAAIGAGVWAWSVTEGLLVSDRIGALAGVAQAASAVAIGLFTVALAWIGYAALAASRSQAGASMDAVRESQKANAELRIERELSVLPYLSVEEDATLFDTHLGMSMTVRNQTPHVAVRTTMTVHAPPWNRQVPDGPEGRVNLLHDTPKVYEVIPGPGSYQTFGFRLSSADVGDEVVVRLEYSGQLGARVYQTYLLRPRAPKKGDYERFIQVERFIRTSVTGADPIITRDPRLAPGQTYVKQLP